MMSTKKQIEDYDRSGNMPEAWYIKGEKLLIAIGILFNNYSKVKLAKLHKRGFPKSGKILPIIQMLRGMCLECFLKALWLKKGNCLVKNGKYIGIKGVNDHYLHDLAKKLWDIDAEGKDLLKRLSLYIQIGRYPISKNYDLTKIQRLYMGGKGPPTYSLTPKDHTVFKRILKKIDNLYYKKAYNNSIQRT